MFKIPSGRAEIRHERALLYNIYFNFNRVHYQILKLWKFAVGISERERRLFIS
jgi:hypothetical protein